MEEEKMDNWKQFQGTELGSLMASLYSNTNKSKINYPVIKTKTRTNQPLFRPVSNKLDALDPTRSTKRNVKVLVPKVNGKTSNNENNEAVINVIPRRKPESEINKELDDIRMRQAHYRPAYAHAITSDAEKDRLSQIFECKGGKILPESVNYPIKDTPIEISNKIKEKQRIESIKFKRGLNTKNIPSKASLSPKELLAEQITEEVNERYNYINEMKSINALSKEDETRIKSEINQRLKELATVDT
eukprot:gene18998-24816_t